jgi:hypothetical protein
VKSATNALKVTACLLAISAVIAAQQSRVGSPPPQPGFVIAGTVISAADGQPLSRADVVLSSSSDRDLRQTAATGTDGRFSFSQLPAGKYVLAARRQGFVGQGYQQHGSFFTGIAVGPALPVPNLLVRLQPEAVISGKVVDEAGDPVREASVILFYRSLQDGLWATRTANSVPTDDQGSYHFGGLSSGRYFVAVTARPWYASFASRSRNGAFPQGKDRSPLDMAYAVTYFQDVTDFSDATPIDLGAGQHVLADITLTAVPAQHITVRVPEGDLRGGFNANLWQSLGDSANIPMQAGFTMIAPGVYKSDGIAPGSYQVELNTYDPEGGTSTHTDARSVDIGEQNEINVTETSSATITGTVRLLAPRNEDGQLMLTLFAARLSPRVRADVSADGSFSFDRPVTPGQYQITAVSDSGLYIAGLAASGATVAGRTLHIDGPGPVVLKVTMARGVGRVTGTTVRDGKPVSGALVVLVPSDPANNAPLFRADQSDSDGTFTLPAVVPGKYTLLAVDNGWSLEWRNPDALKPYLPRGQKLEIAPEARYNIKPQVQDF